MAGVPTPAHVRDARSRLWDRNAIERTALWLVGISRALRFGAECNPAEAKRYTSRAERLEAEFPALADVIASEATAVRGEDLPDFVVVLLACPDTVSLATTLSIEPRFVYEGKDRMGEVARDVIAADGLPPVVA